MGRVPLPQGSKCRMCVVVCAKDAVPFGSSNIEHGIPTQGQQETIQIKMPPQFGPVYEVRLLRATPHELQIVAAFSSSAAKKLKVKTMISTLMLNPPSSTDRSGRLQTRVNRSFESLLMQGAVRCDADLLPTQLVDGSIQNMSLAKAQTRQSVVDDILEPCMYKCVPSRTPTRKCGWQCRKT